MVLVLAVVLLGIAPFAAQAAVPPSAFTLKVGAYFPQEDLDDLDFDTGLAAEVSFTSYFHPNLAAELGVGYIQSESDIFDAEMMAIPVTLNLKGIIPVGGVELYVLAGIGAYYVQFENNIGFDEDDTVLGFQAGAGANFNITPTMFVGAEAKYLWAEPEFAGVDVKIDGFQATANLGFRF
jgi:outer membrane protein W